MPETVIGPQRVEDNQAFRETRSTWVDVGVDNFTKPPAQDPDKFMQFTNILPPATRVLQRRYGYSAFAPKLDSGSGDGVVGTAVPTIKAGNMFYYQNLHDVIRTIIAAASDGTGSTSISNKVGYWDSSSVFQTIFTPSAGAGRVYAAESRDWEYFADGVAADLKKWNYDPGTGNPTLAGWGTVAPTTAIDIFAVNGTVQSWQPLTVFSTMGFITDASNHIQMLVSVNATGTNANAVLGKTGVGQPSWNQTPNGTTTDSPVTWTNTGPVGLWSAGHAYSNASNNHGTSSAPCTIYDPVTGGIFNQINGGAFPATVTSGSVRPGFDSTVGWTSPTLADGTKWTSLGVIGTQTWKPSTFYPNPAANFGALRGQATVFEPVDVISAYNASTGAFTQDVFAQTSTTSGTTPASESHPFWTATTGVFTSDNQLRWLDMGTKTWASGGTVIGWAPGSTTFTVIYDGANYQVCMVGGTNSVGAPSWGTNYGDLTTDGAVQWRCVGQQLTWAASTQWYLPANGFVPPASSSAFGGASIIDTNSVLESVIESGKSGSTAPVWPGVGSTVGDPSVGAGNITWKAIETVTAGGLGNVTLTNGGRRYYVVFQNSTAGTLSDVGPISEITGNVTNAQIFLTNIPVSNDSQIDTKLILSTADGGDPTTLYLIGSIPNSQTTFTDNISEINLLLQPIYQETDISGNLIGVFNNQPPPNGLYPTLHKNRIWLIKGDDLYFSKSLADVITSTGTVAGNPEEAFDPNNTLACSLDAEKVTGLLSDGYSLYIGTERHVKRLAGDSPSNFVLPNTIFSEAGVMNQRVWKIVFVREQPVGAMWITPDFRVLESDFNVYSNVGEKIQTTLNSINPAALDACWATFVAYDTYAFYALFIPTGNNTSPDTLCLFDLQRRQWYIWQFADNFLSGLYYVSLSGVPRWINADTNGDIRFINRTDVTDRALDTPVGIASTIQTSWMPLGDGQMRKLLNEIEVGTSLSGTLVTVEGATTQADFTSPHTVISNAPLVRNFLGDYKVFLAGSTTKDRYYRFTFTTTSTIASTIADVLMSSYGIEVIPVSRI